MAAAAAAAGGEGSSSGLSRRWFLRRPSTALRLAAGCVIHCLHPKCGGLLCGAPRTAGCAPPQPLVTPTNRRSVPGVPPPALVSPCRATAKTPATVEAPMSTRARRGAAKTPAK